MHTYYTYMYKQTNTFTTKVVLVILPMSPTYAIAIQSYLLLSCLKFHCQASQ